MNLQEKIQKILNRLGDERADFFKGLQMAGEKGDWSAVNENSFWLAIAEARIEGFVQAVELFRIPQAEATQSTAIPSTPDTAVTP